MVELNRLNNREPGYAAVRASAWSWHCSGLCASGVLRLPAVGLVITYCTGH